MSQLSQLQIDTNRANALNARNAFLNDVAPKVLEVLKNGVKRKNDNSLYEKYRKQIDEILNTNRPLNGVRVRIETSPHSKSLIISCDIRYTVREDDRGYSSVSYSNVFIELLGYEGEVVDFLPLNASHDAEMYAAAREELRNVRKIMSEYKDKASELNKILED